MVQYQNTWRISGLFSGNFLIKHRDLLTAKQISNIIHLNNCSRKLKKNQHIEFEYNKEHSSSGDIDANKAFALVLSSNWAGSVMTSLRKQNKDFDNIKEDLGK